MRPRTRLALVAGLALIASLALASPAAALEQKLTPSVSSDSGFGTSAAIDGDTLVVGAPGFAGPTAPAGAVYVFQLSNGVWVQVARLTASDAAVGDRLGSSVAIDGDTIVAGAPGDDSGRGAIYTFARTGAADRTQTAKLTASDGAAGDLLGFSVAIDGDTIVGGAYHHDAVKGEAYTFASTGAATRTETARLTASDGAPGDFFGVAVAIDGDTIVAGAGGDDSLRGSVYTFASTGGNRTQTAKLTASDAAAGDALGRSVAIDGETIVAGAYGDDPDASNVGTGAAYTFARTGAAARTQTAKLTASNPQVGEGLGFSVAVGGDTIVAGAPDRGDWNGAVYTFAGSGPAARTETGLLTASDALIAEFLGTSVAIEGDTIVGGAPQANAAYVFSPTPPPDGSAPPIVQPPPGKTPAPATKCPALRKKFRRQTRKLRRADSRHRHKLETKRRKTAKQLKKNGC